MENTQRRIEVDLCRPRHPDIPTIAWDDRLTVIRSMVKTTMLSDDIEDDITASMKITQLSELYADEAQTLFDTITANCLVYQNLKGHMVSLDHILHEISKDGIQAVDCLHFCAYLRLSLITLDDYIGLAPSSPHEQSFLISAIERNASLIRFFDGLSEGVMQGKKPEDLALPHSMKFQQLLSGSLLLDHRMF